MTSPVEPSNRQHESEHGMLFIEQKFTMATNQTKSSIDLLVMECCSRSFAAVCAELNTEVDEVVGDVHLQWVHAVAAVGILQDIAKCAKQSK